MNAAIEAANDAFKAANDELGTLGDRPESSQPDEGDELTGSILPVADPDPLQPAPLGDLPPIDRRNATTYGAPANWSMYSPQATGAEQRIVATTSSGTAALVTRALDKAETTGDYTDFERFYGDTDINQLTADESVPEPSFLRRRVHALWGGVRRLGGRMDRNGERMADALSELGNGLLQLSGVTQAQEDARGLRQELRRPGLGRVGAAFESLVNGVQQLPEVVEGRAYRDLVAERYDKAKTHFFKQLKAGLRGSMAILLEGSAPAPQARQPRHARS
jgi:hypothetical protein